MLLGRATTAARDAERPQPDAGLVSAAGRARRRDLGGARSRSGARRRGGVAGRASLVTVAAVAAWLAESARRQVAAERAWIAASLAVPGRRYSEDGEGSKLKVFDLRPGEMVLVEPGEVVPVDLIVSGGDVEVLPWIGATTPARRREGDAVVAGARVVRGRLRGVCTWAGLDRAFARVLIDPRRRADVLAPDLPRLAPPRRALGRGRRRHRRLLRRSSPGATPSRWR